MLGANRLITPYLDLVLVHHVVEDVELVLLPGGVLLHLRVLRGGGRDHGLDRRVGVRLRRRHQRREKCQSGEHSASLQ